MGLVVPVLSEVRGMQTDPPLDQMPQGFLRRIKDYIPLPAFAMAESRGGWAWKTGAITHNTGGHKYFTLVWAPFSGAPRLILSGAGHYGASGALDAAFVYATNLDGSDTGSSIGTFGQIPSWLPTFHAAGSTELVIFPGSKTDYSPQKWPGSGAIADLGGSPPKGRIAHSWGDYLLLGGDLDSVHENRLWFSDVGDPESWNLTSGYVDFPERISGIASRGNTIFVFGSKGVHLLIGDTPPPGGNLTLKKYAFSQGIPSKASFFSTTTYKDFVIWANGSGVFKSDGSQPIDLTQLGGISSYWPFAFEADQNDIVSLGVYKNFLFVSIITSSGAAKTCLIYNLEENSWWEWGNIYARNLCATPSYAYPEDLLWIDVADQKIVSLAAAFTGSGATGILNDDDGAALEPTMITGAYRLGGFGQKRVRRGFLSYALRTATTLTVEATTDIAPDPEASPVTFQSNGGSTTVFTGEFLGTADRAVIRSPFRIDRKAEMLQFSLVGDSTGIRVYGIEVEASPYGDTRDGDSRS